jgi:oligosaccharide translocation protein RFT1
MIGSLIARILFQPLEESLRTILSSLLSAPNPKSLQQSSTLITTLLKLHILLAILIHTLIPSLMSALALPVLSMLIGQNRFPPNALLPILYAYLYYIPIMAINGVTESFIASVATTGDLARQSRAMIVFSVIFLAASWGLLRGLGMGGEGLVWANCINLGVRIIWSCKFITKWYAVRNGNVGWNRIFPSKGTMISSVLFGLGVRMGAAHANGFVEAVVLVGISGFSVVGCMYSPTFQD